MTDEVEVEVTNQAFQDILMGWSIGKSEVKNTLSDILLNGDHLCIPSLESGWVIRDGNSRQHFVVIKPIDVDGVKKVKKWQVLYALFGNHALNSFGKPITIKSSPLKGKQITMLFPKSNS